jgi:hypothetical protein
MMHMALHNAGNINQKANLREIGFLLISLYVMAIIVSRGDLIQVGFQSRCGTG